MLDFCRPCCCWPLAMRHGRGQRYCYRCDTVFQMYFRFTHHLPMWFRLWFRCGFGCRRLSEVVRCVPSIKTLGTLVNFNDLTSKSILGLRHLNLNLNLNVMRSRCTGHARGGTCPGRRTGKSRATTWPVNRTLHRIILIPSPHLFKSRQILDLRCGLLRIPAPMQ